MGRAENRLGGDFMSIVIWSKKSMPHVRAECRINPTNILLSVKNTAARRDGAALTEEENEYWAAENGPEVGEPFDPVQRLGHASHVTRFHFFLSLLPRNSTWWAH